MKTRGFQHEQIMHIKLFFCLFFLLFALCNCKILDKNEKTIVLKDMNNDALSVLHPFNLDSLIYTTTCISDTIVIEIKTMRVVNDTFKMYSYHGDSVKVLSYKCPEAKAFYRKKVKIKIPEYHKRINIIIVNGMPYNYLFKRKRNNVFYYKY